MVPRENTKSSDAKKKSVCLGVFNKMLQSTSGYTEGAAITFANVKKQNYFEDLYIGI
jgi:hypothetical protein